MSQSLEWEIDNLPNRLTLFRIILIPFIIACLYLTLFDFAWMARWEFSLGLIAGVLFIIASITDFLDGYIARRRQIVTVFGSFLDPIADKFLVVSSLIVLQGMGRIPALLVVILVLREMYITALRLLAIERGLKVPVGALGKWKTAFQMIGIPMLMIAYEAPYFSLPLIGTFFLYLAALFSVYSAVQYSFKMIHKINILRTKHRKGEQVNK